MQGVLPTTGIQLKSPQGGDFGRQSVISDGDFGRRAVKSNGDFGRCAVYSDAAVIPDAYLCSLLYHYFGSNIANFGW